MTVAIATAMACSGMYASANETGAPSDVIPKPAEVVMNRGFYNLPDGGVTYFIKGNADAAVRSLLEQGPVNAGAAKKMSSANIRVEIGDDADAEGYTLEVTPKYISIKAAGARGAYYGLQTLLQMTDGGRVRQIACCRISDEPRFSYRGVHFDVSRHFRSLDFLKKQVDAMAQMKLNTMHLHFTDGAGWRMQIDKYPRLTEFAAWRPQRTWREWVDNGSKYCDRSDARASGGFYTKEEMRDLVDYAAQRHITVIPEVEMPGHSEEVLAAYPELSCAGKPYSGSDFCVGKEATFRFLEDVLTEVMDVFPSEYIHIGGDEATKNSWRDCPDCKRRMEQEGLKDVDELQSYLIKRIEKFVNSKGRKIIGWDEILEGGVAPNATVMSWRGTEGGIKSLKSGHDVVMTPGAYCYIDGNQDAPFKEPASIGGDLPLAKGYSYEPVEPGLTPEEASHLLGVQVNLWTEHVADSAHAEYMYYPRTYAIAEVGWSKPDKDYDDFYRRALVKNERMKRDGYNVFDLAQEYGERKESLEEIDHLGRGAKVSYNLPYSKQYTANGDLTLTDGVRGGWTYGDKRWQGTMQDFDVTVDLGEVKPLHYFGATFMHSEGAWVHLPEKVEFEVSDDGVTFTPVATVWCDVPSDFPKLLFKDYGTAVNASGRYVRMHAFRNPRPGAWLFTDEFVIN